MVSTASITATIAASAAVLSYADARLGLSTDIKQLRRDRDFSRRIEILIKDLGDHVTLMRLLDLAEGDREGLWFEGQTWSYNQIRGEVSSLCAHLLSQGVKAGDIVAVFMTNSPEMVFTVYALTKIGAVPALVNSSLRAATLHHCFQVAKTRLVICTPDLLDFTNAVLTASQDEVQCVSVNVSSFGSSRTYDPGLKSIDHQQLCPKRTVADLAALIYTSGTTGKPKACGVKNIRICLTTLTTPEDLEAPSKYLPTRIYTCMPLFHGTSFFTGLSYSVGNSGTLCLARKFSASRFFKDIHDSRATRMLYVGELCRYLLAAPESPYDRSHQCIVATGNGLQKDVWVAFQQRFNVPEIREYYRSTEGVAKFDLITLGSFGAGKVAFAGPIRRRLEDDTYIVKYDYDNQTLYRDAKGRCVVVALGEPGEAIGRIRSMATYCEYFGNEDATNSKIVRDVFQEGDMFQRSGDLVLLDKDGWVRFHDRIGDTFRWKGENVSAGEIRGMIGEIPEVGDAIVFGVKLPGYEGQAGAAAIRLKKRSPASENQLMAALHSELKAKGVPNYALPRLVRITNDIDTNATFKHSKNVMLERGWHAVSGSDDVVFWLDRDQYKPLDLESWQSIVAGKAKL